MTEGKITSELGFTRIKKHTKHYLASSISILLIIITDKPSQLILP